MGHRDPRETRVSSGRRVHKVTLDSLVHLDPMDCQEQRDKLEQLVWLEQLVIQELRVPLAQSDFKGNKALPVLKASWVSLVDRAQLVLPVQQDLKDRSVNLDQMVQMAIVVIQEPVAQQVLLAAPVLKEMPVQQVRSERPE